VKANNRVGVRVGEVIPDDQGVADLGLEKLVVHRGPEAPTRSSPTLLVVGRWEVDVLENFFHFPKPIGIDPRHSGQAMHVFLNKDQSKYRNSIFIKVNHRSLHWEGF
jgi:hypothetical protein